jgi:fused signal recognition particle receptor
MQLPIELPGGLMLGQTEIIGLVGFLVLALLLWGGWFMRRRRLAAWEAEGDAGEAEARARIVARPATDGRDRDGFFAGFARSRDALFARLRGVANAEGQARFDQLEEALIAADVGVKPSMALVEVVRKKGKGTDLDALRELLRSELLARLGDAQPIATAPEGPTVILVVGVNGSGKTTTIGKLAARYTREGKKVLLAAGDTFRAGAIEQLKVWGERAKVPVVAHQEGADPAAVIFDGIKAGMARGVDVVICDTAGRLQAQSALMDELAKVQRVMRKAIPTAPHEVLLVLDGTIGQNALSQARTFKQVTGVTGVALTKLDGTAKGGVVVAVGWELGIPVKLVGLGEGMDDLRDFSPGHFVDALLGSADSPA